MSDVVQVPVDEPAPKRAKTIDGIRFDLRQFVGHCPVCLISHDEAYMKGGEDTCFYWTCHCRSINPCCSEDCARGLLEDNKRRDRCVFRQECKKKGPLPDAPLPVEKNHPAYSLPGEVPKICENCGIPQAAKYYKEHQRVCPKLLVQPDERFDCGCNLVELAKAETFECCPHCKKRMCPRCARPCTVDSCESMLRSSPDGLKTGTAGEIQDYQLRRKSEHFGFMDDHILKWSSPFDLSRRPEGYSLMRFLIDPSAKLDPAVLDMCLLSTDRQTALVRSPRSTLCGRNGCHKCSGFGWAGLRHVYDFRTSPCAKMFVESVVQNNMKNRCVELQIYQSGERLIADGSAIPLKILYNIDVRKRKIHFQACHVGPLPEVGVTTDILVKVSRTYASGYLEPIRGQGTTLTVSNDATFATFVYDCGRKLSRPEYFVLVTIMRQRIGDTTY